jgi:glucose-1-phosphate adenylyltransferase
MPRGTGWYQGTDDAVRQQLMEIEAACTEYVLILAGDHLYNMDYCAFVEYHVETGATSPWRSKREHYRFVNNC